MLRRTGSFFKQLGIATAFCAIAGLAVPAFADPPAHAPAHGWRKKNDPYYVGYTGRQWPADYGIIDGRCNRDAIGTVIGGVVGGVIGSQIGEGDDRKVAIILGTVIGAVIGREIGRDMDESDRACMGHALELARDGQAVRWLNPRTGVTFVVTPVAVTKKTPSCRNFKLQMSRDSRSQSQNSRACRSGDGAWQIAG